LKGFESATHHTELGELPSDWDTPKLSDLFTFKNGLNKSKQYFGRGTPIVNYMDVYRRRGLRATDLSGRVSVDQSELKRFEVRKGDVLFTRTSETAAEVGTSSVMLDDLKDTVFSGFVLRARPIDRSLDDHFKQYCFATDSVRKQITSQTIETTRALTNGRILGGVLIARPPLLEQQAIATVLDAMDAEITALERRRDKTTDVKQGMMQALLTGRIRLAQPEVIGA
jgi:type I restriction enzyme, S subunit